ncbi:cytochrome c [Granulosicoccaceae sp. 1_MG-2023]|nr:cytochrome c [Granulosicoccaceae sp. 1_MG-2023]
MRITAAAALMTAVSLPALAEDPFETEIEARQGLMQVYKYNVGILAAMAKGEADYDAEAAQKAADNIKLVTMMDNGGLWAPGSDSDSVEDSKAAPELWSTFPKVGEYGEEMASAAAAMADNAGQGLDALKANIGPLGKSCKTCHDDFRVK